jgi:hypothetical protein
MTDDYIERWLKGSTILKSKFTININNILGIFRNYTV